jgi:Zn-dependent protease
MMRFFDFTTILIITKYFIPVVLAITLHEVAHGYAAMKLGDPTAHLAGRISLNPLRHIHPVGTLLMPLVLAMLNLPIFGFARPVPVNFSRLRRPRRDMALVALAGPLANLVMMLLWLWLLVMAHRLGFLSKTPSFETLVNYRENTIAEVGILINLVLMIFNLLPILPLDGGRIVASLLPPQHTAQIQKLEFFSLIALVVLLLTGALPYIIAYPVFFAAYHLMNLFF